MTPIPLYPLFKSYVYFVVQENWNWGSMDERKTPVHPSVRSVAGTWKSKGSNMSQRIDRTARIAFPVLFLVFNVLYHFYFNII